MVQGEIIETRMEDGELRMAKEKEDDVFAPSSVFNSLFSP
jgi:hypothetical protein